MGRDITSIAPVSADARMSYGPAPSQFVDIWRARGSVSRGCAVMVHGGFWRARYDLAHASHLCAALAEQGVSVANIEYRRVGEPGGGWPGTLEDLAVACRSVAGALGGDVVAIGHSAGGHLALRLASESLPLRGVVALAPVACLDAAHRLNLSQGAVAAFLGSDPNQSPAALQAACPSRRPSAVRRSLVHGVRDDVVPIEISRTFVERRQGDSGPVTLIELDKTDHFDVIDPESAAWATVRDEVLALLG